MISISRNFKILIIDDNETDLKVVQRLISKDYKSIDVTTRSGVTDWKIFLEGNKFDMILLNYAAGSSVGLQEIKKIIAINDTIPIYIMIWQHEVEVGMKAIYQGAEGFVIKDKTYLNLKKVIQRCMLNYLVFSELNSLREINDIISEEVNDGFFRFSKEGDLEYISDKFASQLGYDSEFETGSIYANLFNEIKEHIKSADDYDREISFVFETSGKNDKQFWFQVFVYKKIDLRNDSLYYEGVLKNISETRSLEQVIKNLKDEKDLLLNCSPLPIEVYNKEGKKISSNPAFTKMLAGVDVSIKDPLSKIPEAQTLKENLHKTTEVSSFAVNNQRITFGNKEKYFDINYISSKENQESVFAFYNDISENVKYRRIISDVNNRKNAFYNSVEIGFIETDIEGNIIEISEKALAFLGKGMNDYSGTSVFELFNDGNAAAVKNALSECKKNGFHNFTTDSFLKLSFQNIKSSSKELSGFIIAIDNIVKIIETEEAYKSSAEKVVLFSNIENIFLWVGTLSGGNLKTEYCSKAVEKITGFTVDETLEPESELINLLFDVKENNSKDKLLKYFKENSESEKNLKTKKGEIRRIKLHINLQKENKDYYRISALVEDITKISKRNSSYSGAVYSTANALNIEDSALFKLDDKFSIQEIIHSSQSFSKEITLGNKLHVLAGIKGDVISAEVEKALRENLVLDFNLINEEEPKRQFKIIATPYMDFAGVKSLYVYIKDITYAENLKNDFSDLSKIIDSIKEYNNSLVLILENDQIILSNYGIENLINYKKDELKNEYFKTIFAETVDYEDYIKQIKHLKKKNHVEFAIQLKDKNNDIKYCRFEASILQKNESIERILLVGKDESETERLKKELNYKNELESILSSSAGDAVIAWSSDSVVYSNSAMDSLFGYSRKELNNLDKTELFAPIQENYSKEIIAKVFDNDYQDQSKPFEVICKKKHGQEFFAEAALSHYQLQSNPVSMLAIKDITDRKHLEKALFNIDNRFRGVIDSMNEGIWLFDGEYKTVFISPKALGFLNYAIDEILEKRIFYFIKDSKFEFDKRFFEESPEAKYTNLSLSFICKNNNLFDSKVNIIPLKDEKGAFLGGILSLTDTSEISNRETEISNLKEKNSSLDKKIRTLESDLEEARKLISDYKKASENLILELEEKINSSKNLVTELDNNKNHLFRLYSAIQSNLRGQITNISSFAEFIEQVWDTIASSQQEAYIKILLSNAKQSFRIFDKISLLSQVAENKLKIKPGILNLSSCISSIIEEKKDKFLAKGITIENEIKDNLEINGDSKLIGLVFDEILINAANFSNKNGNIKIFLQPVHDKTSLTILDNGSGISPDRLNRIFDFNQSYSVYSSNGNLGSGITLLIAKEIIKRHNGAIDITSEEGKGTKVNIILPSANQNIFLIGSETDCEIIRSYVKNNIKEFEAENFFETETALKKITEGIIPCAIFVTFSQPEEKFFGFFDKLRGGEKMNTIPIVVMSSDSSDEFRAKLFEKGISTLINLPLNEKNISSAFSEIMFK